MPGVTSSQAVRRDALPMQERPEDVLRRRQAQRALPIKRGGLGQVFAERAVRGRRPPSSSLVTLAMLSGGLKQVMPIPALLLFAAVACAQSEPVQETQGVGEVIVDTFDLDSHGNHRVLSRHGRREPRVWCVRSDSDCD